MAAGTRRRARGRTAATASANGTASTTAPAKFTQRLAAGAAAHGLRRRGLEVHAEAGEVVGQLRLVAHPVGSSAGLSAVVRVRSARETRSRAAFWLQPSSPATSS